MTFREQWEAQRARAVMLQEICGVPELELVAVKYPGLPARVSIIGGAILRCAPELWRAQGARVHRLAGPGGGLVKCGRQHG